MNINITVFTCLKLIPVHKEFPVKLLVQLIKNQASLCGNKGAVRICITLVSNVTDRLTFCIYIVHHMDKIKLIIPVIPITFCNSRIYTLKSSLYDIVHFLDLDLVFSKRIGVLLCKTTDKIFLLIRKCIKYTRSGFIYCCHNFQRIELLLRPIFLNHINHTIFLPITISSYNFQFFSSSHPYMVLTRV